MAIEHFVRIKRLLEEQQHALQNIYRKLRDGGVPSKEQEKEGFSIPAQWKLLDQYATSEGFSVVRDFVDIETAKKPGRPGFEEMVKFLRRSSVRVLLVEKTDRLYRNLKDYVTMDDLDIEIDTIAVANTARQRQKAAGATSNDLRPIWLRR